MAMYVLAPLADADVEEIWSYVAQYDSEYADTYIQELVLEFSFLAKNPKAGKLRPDLDPGLRFFPYRRYCIFYYTATYGIEISRILHSAQDIESILGESFDE
jgi:toxin ParE1/3/4